MTHRGKIVEKVARTESGNISDLAKKLGYKSRTTIYLHFEDRELPYEVINQYGKALKHDFTQEFPDMVVTEPVVDYKPKTQRELEREADYWKGKYIELLERYNEMVLKELQKSGSDNAPT